MVQKQIDEIIQRGRERGRVPGCEVHHIIMRSLGGADVEENLVPLLPREHYEIHKLYWLRDRDCEKSALAFLFMSDQHRIQSGIEYEEARKLVREKTFERNGWVDTIIWSQNHGKIEMSAEFNSQAFMDKYYPEKPKDNRLITKVLRGETPYVFGEWRLSDSGLYEKVKEKVSRQYEIIVIRNLETSEEKIILREDQNHFYDEYGVQKGSGRLQQLSVGYRKSITDKHGHKWIKLESE